LGAFLKDLAKASCFLKAKSVNKFNKTELLKLKNFRLKALFNSIPNSNNFKDFGEFVFLKFFINNYTKLINKEENV